MDFLRRFWSIKGGSILLMGLAFFIVTFGQPAWLPWLGLVAAVCGYALFWKGSFAFKSMWVRFALSSVWFTAVEFTQLSWMSADDYQGRYIWFVWSLLSLICGLQFGVLSFFVRPNPKITLLRTLTVPSIWVLMEWSRLAITAGFTWNPVGIALTGYPLTTQLVSVVGVYGLSFFVMLANILFLQLCTAPFQKRRWAYAAVAAGVPYLFGAVHLFVHSQKMESDERSPLAVVLVQTGLGPLEKGSVQLRHPRAVPPFEQWRRILALLSDHKERRIDLVVLPEAAVPLEAAFPFYDSRVAEHLVRRYCSDRRPSSRIPSFARQLPIL